MCKPLVCWAAHVKMSKPTTPHLESSRIKFRFPTPTALNPMSVTGGDLRMAGGPMGLEELCSYKYIIHGSGQIR